MVNMMYTYADGTTVTEDKMASVWIQDALAKVATPMAGSPGALRLVSRDAGEKHSSHNLSANGCGSDATATAPANYTFCEFAVLNKANTHESRVHHVETPNGVLRDDPFTAGEVEGAPANGYVPVDVGFVWITELQYQINAGNDLVTGMNGNDQTTAPLGIPNDGNVNGNKTYSLALLATSKNNKRGQQFIDFLRDTGFGGGQEVYTAGGFTGLTDAELAGGEVYDCDGNGVADVITPATSTTPALAVPQTC